MCTCVVYTDDDNKINKRYFRKSIVPSPPPYLFIILFVISKNVDRITWIGPVALRNKNVIVMGIKRTLKLCSVYIMYIFYENKYYSVYALKCFYITSTIKFK